MHNEQQQQHQQQRPNNARAAPAGGQSLSLAASASASASASGADSLQQPQQRLSNGLPSADTPPVERDQLGRRLHLQQQHQSQQQFQSDAFFSSTIWTPHLRQPLASPLPPLPQGPSLAQLAADAELAFLQQNSVSAGPKQQQVATQFGGSPGGGAATTSSPLVYGLLVLLCLVALLALVALLLVRLPSGMGACHLGQSLGGVTRAGGPHVYQQQQQHESSPASRLLLLHPVDKLRRLANWLLRRRPTFPPTYHPHHRGHLHASTSAKYKREHPLAGGSPDGSSAASGSASGGWPIVGAFSSSTLGSHLRAGQLVNSSSLIVGLNPLMTSHRLSGNLQQQQQQQQQQHLHHAQQLASHKTISGHMKQQFCLASQQAGKLAAMVNQNYGQVHQADGSNLGPSLGHSLAGQNQTNGYYSTINYADQLSSGSGSGSSNHEQNNADENHFGPMHSYQQQPATADLLGTGYQCQQHSSGLTSPLQQLPPLPPPPLNLGQQIYHISNNNNSSQTTRLIWSSNGTNSSAANEPMGYSLDGTAAYMPLSSGSSGTNLGATLAARLAAGMAPNGSHHSHSSTTDASTNSPIYQTIY